MSEIVRGQIGLGMGGHHKPNRGDKDEWITPKHITDALGPFDLDPCAPISPPWTIATNTYTEETPDGLAEPWEGFVWCNPPYGPQTWKWLAKLAAHESGGIALIFARTETAGFFEEVWQKATGIMFLEGRLFFHHVDGTRAAHNSGAPSCLVAYGLEAIERLQKARINGTLKGALVERWWRP